MNEINCVKVTTDKLFTGEKTGYIYMYQIEKGLELEGFGPNRFNSPVITILIYKVNIWMCVDCKFYYHD